MSDKKITTKKRMVRATAPCFFNKSRKAVGAVFEASIDDISNYPFLELAVTSGVVSSSSVDADIDDEVAEDPKIELTEAEKQKAIQEAAYALDYQDDALWTGQGLPQVSAVEDVVGFDVSRSDIKQATGDYTRETAEEKQKVSA
jgi:hypothetical protein